MLITLVTPPSQFLLDERVFVSLGILKVGASLELAGHSVEHLDLSGVDGFCEVVTRYCQTTDSRVFALTATTPQMPAAVKIANTIFAVLPAAKVIIGGPHVTLLNAAAKLEAKENRVGRAHRELGRAQSAFTNIVAGDGEKSIHQALVSDAQLIDADDPASEFWLTSQGFTDSPWPARHLVDLESYHYSIDNERAAHLVCQLGCLAPETPIMLESGISLPIKDVQNGDNVLCFDVDSQEFTVAPVSAVWKREANDVHELTWDDGTTLFITGEHPVWTDAGWCTVDGLETQRLCASMPAVPKRISSGGSFTGGKILQPSLSMAVATGTCKSGVGEGWTSEDACSLRSDDERREVSVLHGGTQQYPRSDAAHSTTPVQHEVRRSKSHEAARSGRQGIGNHQEAMGRVLFRSDEEHMATRQDWPAYMWGARRFPKQAGSQTDRDSGNGSANIQVCRERSILGGAVTCRETKEPRLRGHEGEEGNTASRRVLAFPQLRDEREQGLPRLRMDSDGDLVSSTSPSREASPITSPNLVWRRLISKRFIGKGTVHNITVHPVHTYFAAGMLVHNCPFACGFCGGRNSFMLRRIRLRDTASVISEMEHLHLKYGFKGMMLNDDELNVNKQMIPLMQAIRQLGDKYGFQWKLRGFVKAELFTDEQAQAMYEAGFRWLLCGFESAHPRILRNINKKATLEDNTRMLRIAHAHGLKVKALMSFGHPAESEETILATRDWLLQEKPDDFDCTVITEYPGTPYWDSSIHVHDDVYCYEYKGDKLYSRDIDFMKDSAFYKGRPGDYTAFVWTDFLTPERLVELRDYVEEEVRTKLGIPYPALPTTQFESSMGQHRIPSNILRGTACQTSLS